MCLGCMSTEVEISGDISGDIDTPLIEKEQPKTFSMANWTNIGLSGNIRDILTQQVR